MELNLETELIKAHLSVLEREDERFNCLFLQVKDNHLYVYSTDAYIFFLSWQEFPASDVYANIDSSLLSFILKQGKKASSIFVQIDEKTVSFPEYNVSSAVIEKPSLRWMELFAQRDGEISVYPSPLPKAMAKVDKIMKTLKLGEFKLVAAAGGRSFYFYLSQYNEWHNCGVLAWTFNEAQIVVPPFVDSVSKSQ